jgi:hypothetical protein
MTRVRETRRVLFQCRVRHTTFQAIPIAAGWRGGTGPCSEVDGPLDNDNAALDGTEFAFSIAQIVLASLQRAAKGDKYDSSGND